MIRLIILMLVLISQPLFASDCEGTWSFRVDANKAEKRQKDHTSVWIPMTLELSSTLLECGKQVTFHFSNKQEFVLSGNSGAIDVQWFDSSFNPLRKNSAGYYYLPVAGQVTKEVWLRLPNASLAIPGVYKSLLTLKLDSSNPKSQVVSYRVKPVVGIDINASKYAWMSGRGSNYKVDLGVLKEGLRRQFAIDLRSNAKVRMSIDAKNGNLLHSTGEYEIPYRLRVNGQSVKTNSKETIHLGSLGGSRKMKVPFIFTVGNVDYAMAGKYTEQITVTVTAY